MLLRVLALVGGLLVVAVSLAPLSSGSKALGLLAGVALAAPLLWTSRGRR
jgi:hypothetical protein